MEVLLFWQRGGIHFLERESVTIRFASKFVFHMALGCQFGMFFWVRLEGSPDEKQMCGEFNQQNEDGLIAEHQSLAMIGLYTC